MVYVCTGRRRRHEQTLTALYDSFYTPPQAADTRAEIKAIHKQLILKLDKPERRLVLRLIDAKDRLAEETSMDSSVCGFRLAWRLANELNSYSESGRPTQSGQTERDARCTPQERWELPEEVNTSPALAAPCWPLCGRCGALLETRRAEPETPQPFVPLVAKISAAPDIG